MSKRAVVLAGGKGTRLRPYTVVLPKPLMPIGNAPILEVIVRQLAIHGFSHITMAVNHQAEIIKAFFGNGEKWGIEIDYSLETEALGTIGPLRLIDDLPDNFLVMNGDVLTDLNFSDLYRYHIQQENIFTISSYQRQQVVDYGVLVPDQNGFLCQFNEKPRFDYEVSMGVYVMSHKALAYIPEVGAYGFDTLMLDLIQAKAPARTKHFNGYWMDIGRPEDYVQAIEDFDQMSERFLGE